MSPFVLPFAAGRTEKTADGTGKYNIIVYFCIGIATLCRTAADGQERPTAAQTEKAK